MKLVVSRSLLGPFYIYSVLSVQGHLNLKCGKPSEEIVLV
jgi:hypothetical protein